MNDLSNKSELIPGICPICGNRYPPSEERTIPTCANPDCIREAKRRGLITETPSPIPETELETTREPALAKPKKGKRKLPTPDTPDSEPTDDC